jgi:ribose/xylose/arabinose/galactoside ABC-type transport system permease subunit
MSICGSLALVFSNSGTIQLNPKLWYTVDWMSYKFGVVPVVFLFVLAITLLYLFIQNYTWFGKHVYAIGTNERASWIVGVRTSRMKILCFTAAGACYALGGVIFVSKMVSGGPHVGDSYTLLTIAAVALGGNSMAGGKGSIIKTIIGVTIATIVRNGMTIVGIDSFWQKIVFGSIIIVAAFLTSDHSNKEQVIK